MELKEFKKWLLDNSQDDNELYKESIKCFQVDAYKAAYLYSYLAYLTHIKELIINFYGIPVNHKTDESDINKRRDSWNERKRKLTKEDIWEEETFNFIKQSGEQNIFLLKDSIRNEFTQKKDLRNTAVHHKERDISASTVEELWTFIKYSYPYFVINGSLEVLKELFENYERYSDINSIQDNLEKCLKKYKNLSLDDREKFFKWVDCNVSMYLLTFGSLGDENHYGKFTEEFLEKLFLNVNSEEYEWIDSIESRILYFVTLNNSLFDKIFQNKQTLIKYIYESTSVNKILSILIPHGCTDKNNKFLKEIFIENQSRKWLDIIYAMYKSYHVADLDTDILNKIINLNEFKNDFNRLEEKLYNVPLTGKGNTLLFFKDYEKLIVEEHFSKNIGLLKIIYLAQLNNIDTNNIGKILVEKSKKIVKKEIENSDVFNILKKDDVIFNWLKNN